MSVLVYGPCIRPTLLDTTARTAVIQPEGCLHIEHLGTRLHSDCDNVYVNGQKDGLLVKDLNEVVVTSTYGEPLVIFNIRRMNIGVGLAIAKRLRGGCAVCDNKRAPFCSENCFRRCLKLCSS